MPAVCTFIDHSTSQEHGELVSYKLRLSELRGQPFMTS